MKRFMPLIVTLIFIAAAALVVYAVDSPPTDVAERGGEKDGEDKSEAYWDELQQMVDDGEISEEDARERYAAYRERLRSSEDDKKDWKKDGKKDWGKEDKKRPKDDVKKVEKDGVWYVYKDGEWHPVTDEKWDDKEHDCCKEKDKEPPVIVIVIDGDEWEEEEEWEEECELREVIYRLFDAVHEGEISAEEALEMLFWHLEEECEEEEEEFDLHDALWATIEALAEDEVSPEDAHHRLMRLLVEELGLEGEEELDRLHAHLDRIVGAVADGEMTVDEAMGALHHILEGDE
jgi:hypothetical protein